MSDPGVWGTACKTCRRLGRKCDRTLPTCQRCKLRGVTCEGYVLRWVGNVARGPVAAATEEITPYSRPKRRPSRPSIDKNELQHITSPENSTTVVPLSQLSSRLVQEVQDVSTVSPVTSMLPQENRAIAVNSALCQPNPMMELAPPNDNLGGLIGNCETFLLY